MTGALAVKRLRLVGLEWGRSTECWRVFVCGWFLRCLRFRYRYWKVACKILKRTVVRPLVLQDLALRPSTSTFDINVSSLLLRTTFQMRFSQLGCAPNISYSIEETRWPRLDARPRLIDFLSISWKPSETCRRQIEQSQLVIHSVRPLARQPNLYPPPRKEPSHRDSHLLLQARCRPLKP